jgi:3-oxocholest-4-en-26-oate---CoA ligase
MSGWNFADIWEACADIHPAAEALVMGHRRVTWQDFDRRADGVAKHLLDGGAQHQDKVAQYLYNCPEYLESVFACFKASLVPVNTNYRYTDAELVYLWDNSDAVAVVFHGTFVPTIERIRDQLGKVKTWLWVDDDSHACPDWATPYESAASTNPGRVTGPTARSGSDLYFIYTGGTTGMPKGTMWEQDTLVQLLLGSNPLVAMPADMAELTARITNDGPGLVAIPGAPLMHGTGALVSFSMLCSAGKIVMLQHRSLDAAEMLSTTKQEKVNAVIIIGDAFAKPLVAELEAKEGTDAYDLSSIVMVVSSGVMWSEATKKAMLRFNPGMILMDSLGSSEAIGMGMNMSMGDAAAKTAKFNLGGKAVVITDDGRLVEAGSGEIGRLGVKGLTPVGYYKDPEKSAATFPVIEGVRYSLPGDFATIDADGTLVLLGRGSVCINSGGEKIFPEEVEEALKTHDSVRDAVAVGVPDEKWGEAVTAVVEAEPGHDIDEAILIAHVRSQLAAFKSPKRVLTIDTIGRAPNAKVDYKRLKQYAVDQLGLASTS